MKAPTLTGKFGTGRLSVSDPGLVDKSMMSLGNFERQIEKTEILWLPAIRGRAVMVSPLMATRAIAQSPARTEFEQLDRERATTNLGRDARARPSSRSGRNRET